MRPLLEQTLAAIIEELKDPETDKTGTLVIQLFQELGTDDLADLLLNEIHDSVPVEVISELLNILIWTTHDNGHCIMHRAEAWLREASDPRKAEIALNLEAYPFKDPLEMKQVLEEVANRFPILNKPCQALIDSRLNPKT